MGVTTLKLEQAVDPYDHSVALQVFAHLDNAPEPPSPVYSSM